MADGEASTNRTVVLTTITVDELAECMRRRGFRAEILTDRSGEAVIRSGSSGIIFHVRFGNAVEGEAGPAFVDFAYVCPLQLDRPPDLEIVDAWNAGRRFGRAYRRDRLFVLEMDVLLAGVDENHLLATLEIWDRLMQQAIQHLRRGSPEAPSTAAAD